MCALSPTCKVFFDYIIKQVAWNKTSLPLMTILQNTQKLQLFTKIFKTENIYKSN